MLEAEKKKAPGKLGCQEKNKQTPPAGQKTVLLWSPGKVFRRTLDSGGRKCVFSRPEAPAGVTARASWAPRPRLSRASLSRTRQAPSRGPRYRPGPPQHRLHRGPRRCPPLPPAAPRHAGRASPRLRRRQGDHLPCDRPTGVHRGRSGSGGKGGKEVAQVSCAAPAHPERGPPHSCGRPGTIAQGLSRFHREPPLRQRAGILPAVAPPPSPF